MPYVPRCFHAWQGPGKKGDAFAPHWALPATYEVFIRIIVKNIYMLGARS